MKNNFQEFENLINKDKYQVFIFSCPVNLLVGFARHPWFVLNKKRKTSRWEIMWFKEVNGTYLHKNTQFLFQDFYISFFIKKYFWKAKLLAYIEGNENSVAQKAIEFIEDSRKNYPYCNKYSFIIGPNSNTYAQWVLNRFPEFNIKLSWNFIGKRF